MQKKNITVVFSVQPSSLPKIEGKPAWLGESIVSLVYNNWREIFDEIVLLIVQCRFKNLFDYEDWWAEGNTQILASCSCDLLLYWLQKCQKHYTFINM